jgi:hypothetical protein
MVMGSKKDVDRYLVKLEGAYALVGLAVVIVGLASVCYTVVSLLRRLG